MFNQDFERGNMLGAEKQLNDNSKQAKGKEKFLFFLNKGTVESILDHPKESNRNFEKAYLFGEDYQTNYFNELGAFVINANMIEYKGEDHEHLLLLYYKAINYLKMGDNESALVECRRLNQRLQRLNDKYKNENKFQRDAFVHTLMGLIYDANKDYNNAFIAYRNAHEIYGEDYTKFFGVHTPLQLQNDILRTAYLSGFYEELSSFEEEFEMKYIHEPNSGGDLIFFWNNGLGPIKYEYSINFSVIHGDGGWVTFNNEQQGWSFPFWIGNDDEASGGFSDLEFYRMAIPRYREREPIFKEAAVWVDSTQYHLELGEDVNQIAHYSLDQRMAAELGKALLRLAIKKTAEAQLRKEDENLGAALGIFNALTEKADTRNWQTLPHSIHYTRVPLPVGEKNVYLQVGIEDNMQIHEFKFKLREGETIFHTFQSLETYPYQYRGLN
jgi:hypothetical protein